MRTSSISPLKWKPYASGEYLPILNLYPVADPIEVVDVTSRRPAAMRDDAHSIAAGHDQIGPSARGSRRLISTDMSAPTGRWDDLPRKTKGSPCADRCGAYLALENPTEYRCAPREPVGAAGFARGRPPKKRTR